MSNPEAIETKVTIENPDIGEEADDVMEMKAISGSGLAQPPTIKVKLTTCFHEFSKYVSTIFFSTKYSVIFILIFSNAQNWEKFAFFDQ